MTFVNPATGDTTEVPPPEYRIVAREFEDHTEAMLYAGTHTCVTVNGSTTARRPRESDIWTVFELVPKDAA